MNFRVFQQQHPRRVPDTDDEWSANLVEQDEIEAASSSEAIRLAAQRAVFRLGKALGRFPIVQEAPNG